jgi:hypothetical protein
MLLITQYRSPVRFFLGAFHSQLFVGLISVVYLRSYHDFHYKYEKKALYFQCFELIYQRLMDAVGKHGPNQGMIVYILSNLKKALGHHYLSMGLSSSNPRIPNL